MFAFFASRRDIERVELSQIFYKNLFSFQQIPYSVAPVWEILFSHDFLAAARASLLGNPLNNPFLLLAISLIKTNLSRE